MKTVLELVSKHLEVRPKYSARGVFSTLFSVSRSVVKHGLSCMIYYLLHAVPAYSGRPLPNSVRDQSTGLLRLSQILYFHAALVNEKQHV